MPIDFCAINQSKVVEIKFNEEKTDKDIIMVAGDASFMPMLNFSPEKGRAFTDLEIQYAARVIVLGPDVVQKLSPKEDIIGKEVKMNGHKFTVIGIPKSRGSMMGQSQDKYVVVPIT
jgi:putative ABC transport system permease protein